MKCISMLSSIVDFILLLFVPSVRPPGLGQYGDKIYGMREFYRYHRHDPKAKSIENDIRQAILLHHQAQRQAIPSQASDLLAQAKARYKEILNKIPGEPVATHNLNLITKNNEHTANT